MRANMQVVHFAIPENLQPNIFKKSPEIRQIAKPIFVAKAFKIRQISGI